MSAPICLFKIKKGFSLIELLVSTVIVGVIAVSGANIFAPLNQSLKQSRLFDKMVMIENQIRTAVYYQGDYSDAENFQIHLGATLIAQHGKTLYLSEDLKDSNDTSINEATYPIQVRLELVGFGAGKLGVIYRISTQDKKIGMRALGYSGKDETVGIDWPKDPTQYLVDNNYLNKAATEVDSSPPIVIPDRLTSSVFKQCERGFLRGLVNGGKDILCWELSPASNAGTWSLPVGYKLIKSSSKIEILTQNLNAPSCPDVQIPLNNGKKMSLPYFYVLKNLDLRDLFPGKKTSDPLYSTCTPVIDFMKYDNANVPNGLIPKAIVNAQAVKACPNTDLYQSSSEGCKPNFDAAAMQQDVKIKLHSGSACHDPQSSGASCL